MEEKEEGRAVVNGVVNDYWWWAAASAVQLGWGVSACRRGYAGPSGLMPFKACAVSTLFVGAFASAAVATLRLSGICTVEDMKTLGANVRAGVGLRSRASDE